MRTVAVVNAGRRPQGSAASGHGRRPAANPGTRRGPSAPSAPRTRSPSAPAPTSRAPRHRPSGTPRRSCGELRVPIVQHQASPSALFAQYQQQVAGLLGDPLAVGLAVTPARWTRRVSSSMKNSTYSRRSQMLSTVRQVAGQDPGGLPAQQRPPGGGHRPWRRIQSVAAQRGADRGRGDGHAEPLALTVDLLGAPGRVLLGQADDQPLHLWVQRGPAGVAGRVGPGAGDQRRCQPNSVSGWTNKQDQRARGSPRLTAASRARSAGSSLGHGVWRRSTMSW